MRTKSFIAVVSSLFFLSVVSTQGQQQGQKGGEGGKGAPLPEGLRHVPTDGMGFLYVRTGAFLESKLGQALRNELLGDGETKDAVKKVVSVLGLKLKEIESVTVVFLEPAESPRFRPIEMRVPAEKWEKPTAPIKGPEKPRFDPEEKKGADSPVGLQQHEQFLGGPVAVQQRPLDPVVFIVTANKPLDRKKMLQRFVSGPLGNFPAELVQPILFLSDRSFAISDPGSLIRFADSGTATAAITSKAGKEFPAGFGRSSLNTLQGPLALAKDNHVLVAGFRLPPTLKKQLLAAMSGPMGRIVGPEITFYPLLNVAWGGLTLAMDQDGADVQLYFKGRNARGAELAIESAKGGLALLELGLENLGQRDQKLADSGWLKPLKKALATAKVQKQGTLVGVEVHADLDAKVIQLAIAEIADKVKQSGARQRSQNNLKQIALAMHNYHDTFRGFPPAALTDKNKKPLLSWRVAILPFIEQSPLYQKFKLDEPWDSEHNKKLIPLMPSIYADPRGKIEPGMTYYQVFVGPGTVFEPFARGGPGNLANIRIPNDIPDGTSNTIMAVEAGKPVLWTKPDDLPFDPKSKTLPPLGGLFPDGFNAALCDGSVRFIRRSVPAETLRLLIMRNDGMPIPEY